MIELLKPKNGRWYFVGTFNQIHWAVRGSDSFPIVPLIYPFRHIQIELTWTEYEKEDQVYQGGVQRFANMDKGIGTKIEMTNIREIEEHPIVVDVILKDGYRATLIFDITLKVFEPLKLVPRKGFLTYVQQEFNDIVAPWANKKKDIDSILQLEIEEVDKDVIFDIYGVKDSLRNYLDSKKFEPFGFRIKELSLRVGIPHESYSYFEIKNKKKHEEAELKRLKAVEKRKTQERETFKNDADNERDIQKKDLAVTGNYQKRIIKEIYAGKERVAGAYKANVLVLNGKDSKDEDETKMLTSSIIGNLVDYKKMEKGE